MAIYRDAGLDPIIADKAPTGQDYASYGAIWVDQSLNDIYIATNSAAGLMVWTPCGGGTGQFSSLSVDPGNASIVSGNFAVTAGTVTIGAFGKGLIFSSGAGLLSSSAGTNGQIVIGKTGDAPLWGSLTCPDGSIGIAVGANTIALTATGATASTFPTDGAVVLPLAGATTIGGDSNITTDGVTPNKVTINLNPSVSVTGKLTAGNDLEMTTGTCLIASDDNAAQAIYLHANGGVNETIDIYSQLGTTATSLNLHSAVGGITVDSGLASATAIHMHASNAAGGFDVTTGTGGITLASTNGVVAITSGTAAMNIGADATVHTLTLGSTTGAAGTVVQSGTGNLSLTSTGTVSAQTTGGFVNIATNAVAAAVSIGNSTGASSVIVDVGTGNLDLGVTATAHTVRIGSTTGVSALTLQAGTGAMTFTAGGAFDVNATGAVTVDSTGAAIDIGAGANAFGINIGTGAAARAIVIGNATTTTSVAVNTGTGDFTVTSQDAAIVDAVGVVELNSSGAAISIGNDADAFGINIGTGAAARTIEIGNNTTTTVVNLSAGSGGVNSDTSVSLTTAGTGFVLQEGPKILAGAGSPNGSVVAPKGSLFLATNGSGVGDRAYINTDGNTAWTAITTAS